MIWLGVALGSAFGAVLRHAAERVHARLHTHDRLWPLHPDLPWATLTVNVLGSALLGATLALSATGRLSELTTAALGAGVAGGITTFSTFALDLATLIRDRKRRLVLAYLSGNLVLGTAAAVAAYRLCGSG